MMDGGTRNLYTKKPVRKIEDLKGMKIRVQGNPLFIDAFNAMGANGIAMDTGEIFSALQTGVIDGAENNPPPDMDALILLGSFIALILIGMPVAYALGLSALIGAWWIDIPFQA